MLRIRISIYNVNMIIIILSHSFWIGPNSHYFPFLSLIFRLVVCFLIWFFLLISTLFIVVSFCRCRRRLLRLYVYDYSLFIIKGKRRRVTSISVSRVGSRESQMWDCEDIYMSIVCSIHLWVFYVRIGLNCWML